MRVVFVLFAPKARHDLVGKALDAAGGSLWLWTVGQFASMAFVGLSATVLLYVLDVPMALSLGLIAALGG